MSIAEIDSLTKSIHMRLVHACESIRRDQTDKTQNHTIDGLNAELSGAPSAKEKRMIDCGRRQWAINPKTGRKSWFTFRCDYMDCLACKMIAIEEQKDELRKIGGPFYTFSGSLESREAAVREIGSESLLCFPVLDMANNKVSMVYISSVKPDDVEGRGVSLMEVGGDWWNSFAWELVLHTPPGRRKSGKLGKTPEPVKDEEDSIPCHIPQFSIEGVTRSQDIIAYRATLAAAISPIDEFENTVTEISFQHAIRQWIDRYSLELHKLGGSLIIHRWMKRLIHPDDISWVDPTDKTYLKNYNADNSEQLLDILADIDCNEEMYEEIGES